MSRREPPAVAAKDVAEAELATLFAETGIDLSALPAVVKPNELAPVIRTTVDALAQDRYRRVGIPYVKLGRRVRYLRADVARYLLAHRKTPGEYEDPPRVTAYPIGAQQITTKGSNP
jgi:hypothetical protein